MLTALVVGTAATGLIAGGLLDPLGQHLAERSRRLEAARAAADETRAAADESSGPTGAEPTLSAEPPYGDGPVPPRTMRVPSGRSPRRTATAAVLTGGLFGAAGEHFGPHLVLAAYGVLFALLVAVSLTDLSHRLVPRLLLYPAFGAIAVVLVTSAGLDDRWRSLAGAAIAGAVAFGMFFTVWWFVPRGMGFGDVRLAGVIGFAVGYLSLLHAYLAFLVGFLLGMVFGVVMMVAAGSGRKTRIPFAPALAAGAVLAVFFGAHWAQVLFGVPS